MNLNHQTIFDLSVPGKYAYELPQEVETEAALSSLLPEQFLRTAPARLPELSEGEVVRHYTQLSNKNYGVDTGMYPLGSCTMKYNPKVNEWAARVDGFANIHPLQPDVTTQGALQLLYELQSDLAVITGMRRMSLQPAAGSQGELSGLMMIKKYHEVHGNMHKNQIIIPDSAHGTNPASVTMAGYETIEIPSNKEGTIDIDALKNALSDRTAGFMLTNPNTLGIFEKDIVQIAKLVHEVGGLLYYDGANMNANMGITNPCIMGFDVVHLNLHKTFSTPHGGGGPGAGPIGVSDLLKDYIPVPFVDFDGTSYFLSQDVPHTIGKVKNFNGNFGVLVRAYAYIRTMGADGLKKASQLAVLNANYMKSRLREHYQVSHEGLCKHEFVLSGLINAGDITTLDVAKALIDKGYHPPTIYFPLIVSQAMMIEPTETESKASIDAYVQALIEIAELALSNPMQLKAAPINASVQRLDEVQAARTPILKYEFPN